MSNSVIKAAFAALSVVVICVVQPGLTVPRRWNFDYSGFEQKDVESLLGAPDYGDFDGTYWFSESNCFGVRIMFWAFKLTYDGQPLKVVQQKKIFAPTILYQMTAHNSLFFERYDNIIKQRR